LATARSPIRPPAHQPRCVCGSVCGPSMVSAAAAAASARAFAPPPLTGATGRKQRRQRLRAALAEAAAVAATAAFDRQATCADPAPCQGRASPQSVGRCRPCSERAKQVGKPLPASGATQSSQRSHQTVEGVVSLAAMPVTPVDLEEENVAEVEAAGACACGAVSLASSQARVCPDPCKPMMENTVNSTIGACMCRCKVDEVQRAVGADQAPSECLQQPQYFGRYWLMLEKAMQFGSLLPVSSAALSSALVSSEPAGTCPSARG